MANNESRGSPRDITRLIVGLLFGSGISGIAIGMIQGGPEVRPWGMAIFVLCLIASGALFWFGEYFIERRERRELRRLGTALGSALDAIVDSAEQYSEKPENLLLSIAKKLQIETDQSLREDKDADWVKVFIENTKHIINTLKKQEEISSKAGKFEEDAIPEIIES